MSYIKESQRLLTDEVIKVFDQYKGHPYPGDVAVAIIKAMDELGFSPHAARDRLWCQALSVHLTTDQIADVLSWFNENRKD